MASTCTRSLSRRECTEAVLRLQPREHAAGEMLKCKGNMTCIDLAHHFIDFTAGSDASASDGGEASSSLDVIALCYEHILGWAT